MAVVKSRGIVLVVTLLMLLVLTALLSSFWMITKLELATTKSSRDSTTGFYAAEAGLNIRAEEIKQTFVGYNVPTGTAPSSGAPCTAGDNGVGDFACSTDTISGHEATTYVQPDASNPVVLTIPQGELYQGLNAQEYRYTVMSTGYNPASDKKEALLELRFKSRLVPLFQFVSFYNKDLEILPGPNMTLNGPVHVNGDLYLNSDATLTMNGQVAASSSVYRGRKNQNTKTGTVRIYNPSVATALGAAGGNRQLVTAAMAAPFNNMLRLGVSPVTVPDPESFEPDSNGVYWSKADLRLVLKLNAAGNPDTTSAATGVEVRNIDGSLNSGATTSINTAATCPGGISGRSIGTTNTFRNNREGAMIRMLEVDLRTLLNCLRSTSWFTSGKLLSDSTEGGLVFYFTVEGPNSAVQNDYGVRIRNAQSLQASTAGSPLVRGMTVVSDQACYLQGHYNSTGKIPAAVMCDVINLLSANWFAGTGDAKSTGALGGRPATATTVNAAFLAGTDSTGGIDSEAGWNGAYNGGLENYPRFHENWTGITSTYMGSFVSLNRPNHSNGAWVYGGTNYNAPNRVWDYDTSFNNAANLPPLTPRFVYLRQELFVRDYEQ